MVQQLSGSLDRGLAILIALGAGEASAAELARRQGVHRSTVVRLLQTLEGSGFVARVGASGRWTLGPTVLSLGGRALGRVDLGGRARPTMERLAAATGESVQLTVRSGDDMVLVDV